MCEASQVWRASDRLGPKHLGRLSKRDIAGKDGLTVNAHAWIILCTLQTICFDVHIFSLHLIVHISLHEFITKAATHTPALHCCNSIKRNAQRNAGVLRFLSEQNIGCPAKSK